MADARTLRLAEVLGTLSLASDLANAQPSEDGLRIATLASRLARYEPAQLRQDVFWAGLLRYLGCSGFAVEEASYASGDDIGLRASLVPVDFGRPTQFVSAAVREIGKGAPPLRRAAGVLKLLSDSGAPRAHAFAQCDAAVACGRRLGMSEGVLTALAQADERFDGRGLPEGLCDEGLSKIQRYVEVARVGVVFNAFGGPLRAKAELQRRAGGHLDPELVRRFERDAVDLLAGLDQASVWDDFLASEPGVWLLNEAGLQPLFEAFALLADLKSGYFSGHSSGVARLARDAARAQGRPADEADLLHRAALLHDLGRVAVPTGIWDKPGPLTPAEWERVRLHSYYTDRVLRRGPALAPYADIAGRAHERMDGSGYPRGERGTAPLAQLLAAADSYHAMLEPRAYRPALGAQRARQALVDEAAQGRLARDAVDAVLQAAGDEPLPLDEAAPALTGRELDVLRLLVLGLSNKEIGKRLGISPRTVQHHTIHIYGKSGAKSRAGAVLWGVEQGLFGAGRC